MNARDQAANRCLSRKAKHASSLKLVAQPPKVVSDGLCNYWLIE
jgi:hypothetical protein